MRNTFTRQRILPCFLLSLTLSPCARGLDVTRPLSSYIKTSFTVEDGLPSNSINALVQTKNGFLWIGTNAGLARFDGRHFAPISLQSAPPAAQSTVRALAQAPDGKLWVGTNSGLARIPGPAQEQFDAAPDVTYRTGNEASDRITSLLLSRTGVLWVGTEAGLFRWEHDKLVPVIQALGITQITEALNGNLLLIARGSFYEWDGTRLLEHTGLARQLGAGVNQFFYALQDRTGTMWFCTNVGIARKHDSQVEPVAPYGVPGVDIALRAYEDDQGTVWAYKSLGLTRPANKVGDVMRLGTAARAIYGGRDGELWVGTNGDGLLRLKDQAVQMFTAGDGLPSNVAMTVLPSRKNIVWTGFNCGGLTAFDGHRFTTYNEKNGLSNSCVWSLAEDSRSELWVGTWGGGLFRFRNGRFAQFSKPQGLSSDIVRSIVAAKDDSLWIGTEDGLSHMVNGEIHNYSTVDGLSSNRVLAVYQDRADAIWVGTSQGVDVLEGDRFRRLASMPAISDPQYIGFGQSSSDSLYALSAPRGINRVLKNRLMNLNLDLDLLNMAPDHAGTVWFSASNGIFSMSETELNRPRSGDRPVNYAALGRDDGLISSQCSVGMPNIAIDASGKLWVATVKGLARVDLTRQHHVLRQPSVFLEEVTIEQKKQHVSHGIIVPPGKHHVEFKFDVIEIESSEKIRFQYRMDGVDSDWLNADSTRTAVYTSIPLGSHSFHIRTCNKEGVWNTQAAVFEINQQRYMHETSWFRAFASLFLVAFLTGLYLLRQRQLVAQHQRLLEERLDERERIARDLHDTLLQGVQGLLLRFQAAMERLPDSEPARKLMESALDRADDVLTEGRDRVSSLRSQATAGDSLAQAIVRTGQELVDGKQVEFRVAEEGPQRSLHPVVMEEAYWIAREALVNALAHSGAAKMSAEVLYLSSTFRLLFRDDGRGIEAAVLHAAERPAHFGLVGMEERAKKIGGHLQIRSETGVGTEIELNVPAAIAYHDKLVVSRWNWLRRFASGDIG